MGINNNMEENKKEVIKKEKIKLNYFGTTGKIAMIFFIAFSLFLIMGTIILILFTKPTKEIKMPDLVGQQFIEVYNSLSRKDLKPIITFRDVNDLEPGLILKQDPEKGQIITEGRSIELMVSRSGVKLSVPNLVGTELPIAKNKLKNLQYQGKTIAVGVGVISYVSSETNASNIIINQYPAANSKISPEQKVNLLVSSGKIESNQKIPNIIGQNINLAYNLLVTKGFTVEEKIISTFKKEDSGKIQSISPRSGSYLKKGGTVVVAIKYFKFKEHPYLAFENVHFIIPNDLSSGEYQALIEDDSEKRVRFIKTMKGGQTINFLFYRKGNAKITILKDKKNISSWVINVEEY